MKVEYKGKDVNPFEEYAKIKEQIATLELERKELETLVQEMLDSEGVKDMVTPYGYYYSMGRKSWEYSDAVNDLSEKLKKMKKIEELEGIATVKKVTSYIMLDTKKRE